MEYVIAVDVATGKEKWSAEAGPLLTNKWGGGPRSTPTVVGDRVFAMSGQGHLVCLMAASGERVWEVSMKDLGGAVPTWGYTESPLVTGDLVLCTPGGKQGTLAAINAATGDVKWRSTSWDDPAQYASAITAEISGTTQASSSP